MSSVSETWTVTGSDSLPIYGNTHTPDGAAKAVALVVHGYTGSRDRNIIPVITEHLAALGLIAHRFTMSHAGIEKDGDRIVKLAEFAADSLAACVYDIRQVMDAVAHGKLEGQGLPLVLVGHSRGGATIIRVAAKAQTEKWPPPLKPAAAIALAPTATYTRFTSEMAQELETKGFIERECSRAEGGVVRQGPSWYQHHFDHPDTDLLALDARHLHCPLLILHGSADDSVPIEHAYRVRDLVAANPHSHVELLDIEGADHNFNISGYGDDLTGRGNPQVRAAETAITAFLNRVLKR